MDPQVLYEIQPGPHWDWRVAADLFLGGAGVGAFLFAVGLDAAFHGRYRRMTQTAAWLAPVLVIAGLLFLVAKLGAPLHLWATFTHFAPTAPLWWGGIFQTLFVAGGLWYAVKWRREDPASGHRRLGLAITPIAVIVGAYHGLLLAAVVARPLWNTGPTVVAALLSFVSTGIAAVMLVHLARMKVAGRLVPGEPLERLLDDLRAVRTILTATLVLLLGTLFLWWLSLKFGVLQDRHALAAANEAHGVLFWSLGVGLGIVLPLLLGAVAVWRGPGANRTLEIRAIVVTSVFILIGGFVFRLAVVLGGQAFLPVPSFS